MPILCDDVRIEDSLTGIFFTLPKEFISQSHKNKSYQPKHFATLVEPGWPPDDRSDRFLG